MRVDDRVFDNVCRQRVANLTDWQVGGVAYRVYVRLQRFISGGKDGVVTTRGKQLGSSGGPYTLSFGIIDIGTERHPFKQCLVIRVVRIGAQDIEHRLALESVHVALIYIIGAGAEQCAKDSSNNSDWEEREDSHIARLLIVCGTCRSFITRKCNKKYYFSLQT